MNAAGTRQSLVVVALEASEGQEYAIELAGELVQAEAPELLGVFVENRELLEYARSRRTREILLTGEERALDAVTLERQMRAQVARARARFEAATSRLGLRHRFEVARGTVFAEAIRRAAAAEALVVSLSHAAGGGVQTLRFVRQLMEARVPRILLTREGWLTGRSIAVILEDVNASNPMLEAAARIAKRSLSPLAALVPVADDTNRAGLGERIEATLGPHGIDRRAVILLSGTNVADLVQATRACRARLLMVPSPTQPNESERLDELLRLFPGALMLVRQ